MDLIDSGYSSCGKNHAAAACGKVNQLLVEPTATFASVPAMAEQLA